MLPWHYRSSARFSSQRFKIAMLLWKRHLKKSITVTEDDSRVSRAPRPSPMELLRLVASEPGMPGGRGHLCHSTAIVRQSTMCQGEHPGPGVEMSPVRKCVLYVKTKGRMFVGVRVWACSVPSRKEPSEQRRRSEWEAEACQGVCPHSEAIPPENPDMDKATAHEDTGMLLHSSLCREGCFPVPICTSLQIGNCLEEVVFWKMTLVIERAKKVSIIFWSWCNTPYY